MQTKGQMLSQKFGILYKRGHSYAIDPTLIWSFGSRIGCVNYQGDRAIPVAEPASRPAGQRWQRFH